MSKSTIKQLVAENKTEQVIDALLNLSDKINDDETKNSVIMLSSRYKRFVDQTIRGVSEMEEQNTYLAQLNDAALKLIDEIPEDYFSENRKGQIAIVYENKLDNTLSKIIKISIIVLFLISLVCMIGVMVYNFSIYLMKSENTKWSNLGTLLPPLTGLTASVFFLLR